LTVIVFTGDGAGIGGNHFLHTTHRNMDLTVIMVNNFNALDAGFATGTEVLV
jgi:2-oxoglutarate/2-oxoacid ferredoxin oxidoreductase subunit beta